MKQSRRSFSLQPSLIFPRPSKKIPGTSWRSTCAAWQTATGDLDASISDFAQEAALNPKSRYRLGDEHCRRGSFYLANKKSDLAIADFEKAIDIETSNDPCQCEPYNPLVAIYLDKQDYGKAKTVVDRALKAGKMIAPEYRRKLDGH
jgi:tetratricopeptide (TPR) repeat protein